MSLIIQKDLDGSLPRAASDRRIKRVAQAIGECCGDRSPAPTASKHEHPSKTDCPGPPGRLSALSVFLCKSVFYGAFVWARRVLNSQKRRFPARAVLKLKRRQLSERALSVGITPKQLELTERKEQQKHEMFGDITCSMDEKDAKLAQKLGQRQPFLAAFPPECTGQLGPFGPT